MPSQELTSSHLALFIQAALIYLQAPLETTGNLPMAHLLIQPLQQIHRNIQLWSTLVTAARMHRLQDRWTTLVTLCWDRRKATWVIKQSSQFTCYLTYVLCKASKPSEPFISPQKNCNLFSIVYAAIYCIHPFNQHSIWITSFLQGRMYGNVSFLIGIL